MGVIDTLSAGFGAINRRPWVIAVPVLLDLFLWLGPRLSAEGVVARALDAYGRLGPPDQQREQLAEMGKQLASSNVFAVLSWQLPSIVTTEAVAPLGERAVLQVQSMALLIGVLLVLAGLGLLGTCLYLGAIAQMVQGEKFDRALYVRSLGGNFRRLVGYFLLLAMALVVFGLPLGVAVALIGMVSPSVAGFLTFLGLAALLWLLLYLFFASYAIFVGGRSPMRAIWESVNLVARNFWPAVGLFVLIHVILMGTGIAWGRVLMHPIGVVAAIVGNAYIASGLAAAAMIFYRERVLLRERVATTKKAGG